MLEEKRNTCLVEIGIHLGKVKQLNISIRSNKIDILYAIPSPVSAWYLLNAYKNAEHKG